MQLLRQRLERGIKDPKTGFKHNIYALGQNGTETCKQLKKPESQRVRNEELIATKNHVRSFITISSQAIKTNAKMSLYNLKTRKVASKEED